MNHLSGYLSAADLVQRMLLVLHRDQTDGLDDLSFPPPRGWQPARVCALTGHRATDACDQVFLEWFRPGEEPVDDCQAHQRRAIDRRTGLLATADTPRSEVEVRTFTELPPRYAAWQAAVALPRPPEAVSAFRPGMMSPGTGVAHAMLDPSRPARLRITSPEDGVRLLRDPETPADLSTARPDRGCRSPRPPGRLVRRRPPLRDGRLPVHDPLEAHAGGSHVPGAAAVLRGGVGGGAGGGAVEKTSRGAGRGKPSPWKFGRPGADSPAVGAPRSFVMSKSSRASFRPRGAGLPAGAKSLETVHERLD